MRPPLVEKAVASGLDPCADELGRLLHVLAAQRGRTRVAQLGAGVGSAWIVAALPPAVPFLLVEADAGRAAAAGALFAADEHVRVLRGDWRHLLPAQAPFDLLVSHDAAHDRHVDLLAPGGTLVAAPPAPRHQRLSTVELELSSRAQVIVGTLQA